MYWEIRGQSMSGVFAVPRCHDFSLIRWAYIVEAQPPRSRLDRSCPGAPARLREGLAETFIISRLGVPPDAAFHQRHGVNDRDLSRPLRPTRSAGAVGRWRSAGGAVGRARGEETVPPRQRLSAPQCLAHCARTERAAGITPFATVRTRTGRRAEHRWPSPKFHGGLDNARCHVGVCNPGSDRPQPWSEQSQWVRQRTVVRTSLTSGARTVRSRSP